MYIHIMLFGLFLLRKWLYLIWLFFTTFCLTEDVWEKNNNKLCDINKTYNFQWRLQKYHIYLWTINGLSKFTIQSRAEAFVFVSVSNQDMSLNETCFYIFRNQQILQNNISDKNMHILAFILDTLLNLLLNSPMCAG